MALKRKITKDEFEALPDHFKAEYKPHGDSFVLDTDDATELQNALDRQKEEAKRTKEELDRIKAEKDAAEQAAREAAAEAAKKSGDVDALETSWKAKLEAAEKKAEERVAATNKRLENLLVRDVARELATEISTAPDLILPHIIARLGAEMDGDEPKTRVLDKAGKPSAMSIDELREEFVANDKFSAIIIGSKAKGGNSGQTSGGGNPAGKKIQDMTEAERVALHRELGATEFQRRAERDRAA
jgi:hypothetical protein